MVAIFSFSFEKPLNQYVVYKYAKYICSVIDINWDMTTGKLGWNAPRISRRPSVEWRSIDRHTIMWSLEQVAVLGARQLFLSYFMPYKSTEIVWPARGSVPASSARRTWLWSRNPRRTALAAQTRSRGNPRRTAMAKRNWSYKTNKILPYSEH